MNLQESIAALGEYSGCLQHLYNTFRYFFETTRFPPSENNRVIDIGCGNSCFGEFLWLSKLYKDHYGHLPRLTFVDKKEKDFARAKAALEPFATFIAGDAQGIDRLVQEKYGLVVIRHPDGEKSRSKKRVWKNILTKTQKILDSRGLLFMTHFGVSGRDCVESLLSQTGYRILAHGKNPHAGPVLVTKTEEIYEVDKFVFVASK